MLKGSIAVWILFFITAVYADDYKGHLDSWLKELTEEANNGDVLSILKLASFYDEEEKDYEKALKWYTKASDMGDPLGKFNVAVFYEEGLSVDKNIPRAMELYEEAARLDFIPAMFNLGNNYCKYYLDTSKIECYYWLRMAADHGDLEALYNLSLHLIEIDNDLQNAIQYLRIASSMGHSPSLVLVNKLKHHSP